MAPPRLSLPRKHEAAAQAVLTSCETDSPVAAILVTGIAFGLSHGLLVALPVLSLFGVILAALRWRTASLYPPIILHAVFNAAALIAAVAFDGGSL